MPLPAPWLQIVNIEALLGASLDQGDAPIPECHRNLEPVLLPKVKGCEEVRVLDAACSDSLLPCMGSWETKQAQAWRLSGEKGQRELDHGARHVHGHLPFLIFNLTDINHIDYLIPIRQGAGQRGFCTV